MKYTFLYVCAYESNSVQKVFFQQNTKEFFFIYIQLFLKLLRNIILFICNKYKYIYKEKKLINIMLFNFKHKLCTSMNIMHIYV